MTRSIDLSGRAGGRTAQHRILLEIATIKINKISSCKRAQKSRKEMREVRGEGDSKKERDVHYVSLLQQEHCKLYIYVLIYKRKNKVKNKTKYI